MQKKRGIMLMALVLAAAVFTGCEMETRTKVDVDSSTWVDAKFLEEREYQSKAREVYRFTSSGTVYIDWYYNNQFSDGDFAYYYTGNPTVVGSTVTMLREIQGTINGNLRDYYVEDDIAGYFTVGSDDTGTYIIGDGDNFPNTFKYYKQ